MKITDNGFSERIATPATRTQQAAELGRNSSTNSSNRGGNSADTLQLSSLASRLQSGSSLDSGRSSRLSAISQAIHSGSFQADSMQISKGLVAEAVSSKAG
jgi:flagellar biosynthesis anti-sigma factor FlgM